MSCRYLHIRPGKRNDEGAITFAFYNLPGTSSEVMSYAVCSPKDKFSKKAGRKLAGSRICMDSHNIEFCDALESGRFHTNNLAMLLLFGLPTLPEFARGILFSHIRWMEFKPDVVVHIISGIYDINKKDYEKKTNRVLTGVLAQSILQEAIAQAEMEEESLRNTEVTDINLN